MKTANSRVLLVVLALFLGMGMSVTASALEPLPSPTTLWNSLGIPQALQRARDDVVNNRGNRPKLERTPPLKAIADPANLESPNPAVKVAAKVKTEEDLAPQKIKAIKYLATVGCGCPQNEAKVRNALLAALDDCTEEVRYEAAVAFCQASGDRCRCIPSCCGVEVMNKLAELAEGKDPQGCWLESSPRVRAAAKLALNSCRPVSGPPPTEVEPIEPREIRAEEPVREEMSPEPSPGDTSSTTPGGIGKVINAVPVGYALVSDGGVTDEIAGGSVRWPVFYAGREVRWCGSVVPGTR